MSVHRIRVHTDRDGDPVDVDLVLPSGPTVGELLPAILDLVDGRPAPATMVHGWRLDRPAGATLSESLSLADNGIHDGELVILTPDQAPPLGPMNLEPCRAVAATGPPTRDRTAALPAAVCVAAALLAATTLTWHGISTQEPDSLIVAAVGAGVAAAAARATGHPTALDMAAVMLAAATGFLTVPSGPAAENAFLGAAAAAAAALLLLRSSGRASAALIGGVTLSALIAVVTVVSLPGAVVGAALSVGALGLLALAPRIAVVAARLGPEHWTDDLDVRAAAGQAALSGLAAGSAAGAASGAALVAFAGVRGGAPTLGAVAFSALVAAILLLRAGTYVDSVPQIVLVGAGSLSGSAAFVTAVVAHPTLACWAGGALIAIGLLTGRRPRVGPAVSRLVDRLEYVALAAVVPGALWVGGAYTLASGVHVS